MIEARVAIHACTQEAESIGDHVKDPRIFLPPKLACVINGVRSPISPKLLRMLTLGAGRLFLRQRRPKETFKTVA